MRSFALRDASTGRLRVHSTDDGRDREGPRFPTSPVPARGWRLITYTVIIHTVIGRHSIRINDQYRLCFRWEDGHADEVEITDYH